MKLSDPEKIKEFVIATIRTGNKERIQKVLQRYFDIFILKKKEDIFETAKKIFKRAD